MATQMKSATPPMPAATRDVEQLKRDMDDYGVAIYSGLLTLEEASTMRQRVEEQAELEREQGVALFADPKLGEHAKRRVLPVVGSRLGHVAQRPPFQMVKFLPNKGRMFIDLAKMEVPRAVAAHVLATDYHVSQYTAIMLSKGAPDQFVHIDQTVLQDRTTHPAEVHCFVSLSAYNEEYGATRFVPGSHKGPAPRYAKGADGAFHNLDQIETVSAELNPGDALFFESRVWHRQGTPQTDDPRVAIALQYGAHWWKPQENYPAAILDTVYDTMTDDELVLFGFEHVRYGGGAFCPRRPDDRRSNTNVPYPYVPELRRGSSARAVQLDPTDA